jgi:pimeloyl-ACP methyl ester carboxylesterase
LRELRDNPAQQQASAYMNFLCRPDAQALLAERDFARLWPFFESMGGASWLTAALRERYRQTWRQGLEGPLNYYRASPLRPPASVRSTGSSATQRPGHAQAEPDATATANQLHNLVLPPAMLRVDVPTMVLWGLRDSALLPGLLDGLKAWVPSLQVQTVADASHWIVHEQPLTVQQAIRQRLGA